MDLSFYTASVGVQMQQARLNVHGDNIANVNNYGFRARVPAFSNLMTGQVRAIEQDYARGVGSRMEDSELDQRPTQFQETGRALDFAIDGRGFFGLLDPGTNEIAYTRDGSFIMSRLDVPSEDPEKEDETMWRLTDGNGRYVLDENREPIVLPALAATAFVDATGAVRSDYHIGIFDFENYNGMTSSSENRLFSVDKNGTQIMGSGKLVQGYLERSNVDLAHEISKVIESQRSFQYMLRMVTTSDEIETTVNQLR